MNICDNSRSWDAKPLRPGPGPKPKNRRQPIEAPRCFGGCPTAHHGKCTTAHTTFWTWDEAVTTITSRCHTFLPPSDTWKGVMILRGGINPGTIKLARSLLPCTHTQRQELNCSYFLHPHSSRHPFSLHQLTPTVHTPTMSHLLPHPLANLLPRPRRLLHPHHLPCDINRWYLDMTERPSGGVWHARRRPRRAGAAFWRRITGRHRYHRHDA